MFMLKKDVAHGMVGVSGVCRNGYQVCNDGTTSPSCTCSGGYNKF